MADTKAKLTLNGDTAVELDMLGSTLGQDVVGIRTLGPKGVFTFDSDFAPAAPCESKIAFINGDEDTLLRHGPPINQLATDSNYLEVCYTLLNDEKPIQGQYDKSKTTVTRHTMAHERITRLFHTFRRDSHSMTVMCGVTGALTTFYYDSLGVNDPRYREIAVFRLLSKMPTMAAMYYKYPIGQPSIYPRNDFSYAGNFLDIMFSIPCEPYGINPIPERAMDRILILHADRKQSASTSTARTAGPLGVSPFAYIATGIASLQGSAHGSVNEAALKVLEETSSVKYIPGFIRRAKDRNDSFRLMGFDYHVYKNYDPRATVMREICHEVLRELDTRDDLLEVAVELENIMLNDPCFIEKKLYPNVDFHSGIVPRAVGISSSMLIVILTMTRTVGQIVYRSEMYNDGMRITRPRQLYTGYEERNFKNDIKRQWLIVKLFTFRTHL